jgi:hypothetical protein
LTQLIADKEKKSTSYKEGKLDSLSDEKAAKIKKFAKEYIAKILRKLEKAGHKPKPPISSVSSSSVPASSTAVDTPNSAEGADTGVTGATVEDVMDDPDEGQGNEDDDEMGSIQSIDRVSDEDMNFVKDDAMDEATRCPARTDSIDPRSRLPNGIKETVRTNGVHFSIKLNGVHEQGEDPASGNVMLVDPSSEG